MKFKLLIVATVLLITGCKTTPVYESKKLSSSFTSGMEENNGVGVIRFDSWVTDELNDSKGIGGAFGLIGALVEHAADDSSEAFAINLQNESMKIIQQKLSKMNPNYINVDLMNKYSVSELTKRFKSNRMWGMGSVKSEEVKEFFTVNPNADFAIHIRSQAAELSKTLWTETSWIIYDKNLQKVGVINTRSTEKLTVKGLTNKQKFEKVIELQKKNVDEFLKIIS